MPTTVITIVIIASLLAVSVLAAARFQKQWQRKVGNAATFALTHWSTLVDRRYGNVVTSASLKEAKRNASEAHKEEIAFLLKRVAGIGHAVDEQRITGVQWKDEMPLRTSRKEVVHGFTREQLSAFARKHGSRPS